MTKITGLSYLFIMWKDKYNISKSSDTFRMNETDSFILVVL